MKLLSRIKIYFFFLACTLGLLFFALSKNTQPKKISIVCLPSDKDTCTYLSLALGEEPTEKAYTEFLTKYKNYPTYSQHQIGHLIGALIYEKEGLSGINYCRNDYNYGCYHGFIGRAIAYEGLGVIEKLKKNCDEGCQHGIGHGILAYLGYKTDNLTSALSICKNSGLIPSKLGCFGGVFMEYNLQTMQGVDAKTRQFDTAIPFRPCNEISTVYQNACFYWLGQWWLNSSSLSFSKLGQLCNKLTENKRTQCYEGLGGSVQQLAGFDLLRNISFCNSLDLSGNLLCRVGAARMFFADPKFTTQSNRFCDDFSGSQKIKCDDLVQTQKYSAIHDLD